MLGEERGHRAFTDRTRDAFDRAVADVSGREHAWHTRLEGYRVPVERPGLRTASTLEQVGPREDVARLIGAHAACLGPPGARLAADTEEQPVSPLALLHPIRNFD